MKKLMIKTWWGLVCVLALAALYFVIIFSFWFSQKDRIYPGVSVAGSDLSGKTKKEAGDLLKDKSDRFLEARINFGGEEMDPKALGITIDPEKTAADALNVGGKNPFFLGRRQDFSYEVSFNQDLLYQKLSAADKKENTPAINSSLIKRAGQISVTPGKPGVRVDFAATAYDLKTKVGQLNRTILIKKSAVEPIFDQNDLNSKLPEIKGKTDLPLTLKNGDSDVATVSPETLISWVELNPSVRSMSEMFEGDPLSEGIYSNVASHSLFSSAAISGYLNELAKMIDQAPQNANLTVSNGQVIVGSPSKEGRAVDLPESTGKIIEALEGGWREAQVVVVPKKADIREDNLSELGLTNLLSSGYSSFAGSPQNRIHNIRTGASKFNGVLIKPNQVFSFNDTLGPVDASTGYLPELVILENKTKPEYGGGMCQVSSTAFRAALNAGFPILERTAHAYPVQYYKPYGVDATVYLPKPDLVFKNDSDHYVLIQTHIEGTRLTFDFYGTKPDHGVKFAGNDQASGAVGIVEQISPLITDQGARGNNSFTAIFWRFITDATGKITRTDKFTSKYDSPDKYPH